MAADVVASNTAELISVLKACCSLPEDNKYSNISLDSMTLLSLLLVQFVSPDVMYNGLPWPEEEFSRVLTPAQERYLTETVINFRLQSSETCLYAGYLPTPLYCGIC